jgi:diguanylate cyclase (GGDEF)-like protein
VVDLDNFKQINDQHGHRSGDQVLVQCGEKLKSRIRMTDTIARSGGDEFNIIVTDLQRPDDCKRIAEGLRSGMAEVELPAGFGQRLSGSIGYAIFPDDGIDAAELCDLADVRMYKDKRRAVMNGVRAVAGLTS